MLHRRAGKTALAVNQLIMEAAKPENAGRTFWYIAPTYSQGKEVVWADPKMLFTFLPQSIIKKKNESELSVQLFNDARIVVKGGEDPDSLLGADPYGIVVDETQSQKSEVYDRVLKPILAANGGWIWFLGTPRFKDQFFHKAIYAQNHPKWQYYHLSAETSGIIGKEELEELRHTSTAEHYRQEYLAEFLDGEGVVFRNVRELCCQLMEKEPKAGHTYQIGVDLARKNDFSVVTVYDCSTRQIVYIDRFNQIDWSYQKARIEAIARKWTDGKNRTKIVLDSTGVGDPIYQDLRDAGLWVYPQVFTNKSKEDLVRNGQIMFDHKLITLPNYKPLIDELEIFEETRSEKTGRSYFSAPDGEGFHDDCVISLCLSLWQAPNAPIKGSSSRRNLMMRKYRGKKTNRYAPRRRDVYSLNDFS